MNIWIDLKQRLWDDSCKDVCVYIHVFFYCIVIV